MNDLAAILADKLYAADMIVGRCPLRPTARTLARPTTEIRVASMWGRGVLQYLTNDGWYGVRLDGETRLDEYPAEYVVAEPVLA